MKKAKNWHSAEGKMHYGAKTGPMPKKGDYGKSEGLSKSMYSGANPSKNKKTY